MTESSSQQPNLRKLAELPYQQLHAKQLEELETTLTDFDLLMATCQAGLQGQLVDDYRESWKALSANGHDKLWVWSDFFLGSAHVLQRGNEQWQANKILLQLACEHADDSPVTKAAEVWLEGDKCDWPWMKDIRRQKGNGVNFLDFVLEEHEGQINGVHVLRGNRLLSWAADGSIRLWNLENGSCLTHYIGHRSPINGVLLLDNDQALSWSDDGTMRLWNLDQNQPIRVINSHNGTIKKVLRAADQVISWGSDETVKIWSISQWLICEQIDVGETGDVQLIEENILLAIGMGPEASLIGIWHLQTDVSPMNISHEDIVLGAILIKKDILVSWDLDDAIYAWNLSSGKLLCKTTTGLTQIGGAILIPPGLTDDNLVVIWDAYGNVEVCDPLKGVISYRFENAHDESINGALLVSGFSDYEEEDGMWLMSQGNPFRPVCIPGQLVTWSDDCTVKVWGQDEYHPKSTHPRIVAKQLQWEEDDSLDLYYSHHQPISGVLPLENNRLLTWSKDGQIRVNKLNKDLFSWEAVEFVLLGHTEPVNGIALADERIISWSEDWTIRVWNLGKKLAGRDYVSEFELSGLGKIESIHLLNEELVKSQASGGSQIMNIETGETMGFFGGVTGQISTYKWDVFWDYLHGPNITVRCRSTLESLRVTPISGGHIFGSYIIDQDTFIFIFCKQGGMFCKVLILPSRKWEEAREEDVDFLRAVVGEEIDFPALLTQSATPPAFVRKSPARSALQGNDENAQWTATSPLWPLLPRLSGRLPNSRIIISEHFDQRANLWQKPRTTIKEKTDCGNMWAIWQGQGNLEVLCRPNNSTLIVSSGSRLHVLKVQHPAG